ncbi:sensor histidine kinase [Roseateles sp. DC23W]|uniref:histidine kinase n=1 Tax=Pelomonas dachongensis TaxID=3299029 RepID=A0ABW7ENY3_9BURK
MSAALGRALPSIRGRLSRSVLMLGLIWALSGTCMVWFAVRAEVNELLDETLQDSGDVLAEVLEMGSFPAGTRSHVVAATASTSHFAWQLVDEQGRLIARSSLAPEQPFHARAQTGIAPEKDGWHSFGRPLGKSVLYVAQTADERRETMAAVGIASAATALLVGLIGLWVLRGRLRRELQPLNDFSDALRRHDPLAPDAGLPAATRAEIAPMHDAIDDLGQRLRRRVANERAFTAHAAHALRTPLAGMDAQLAVALREVPDALRPRLLRVRQAAGRLSRVVTALLTLFRSGVDLKLTPVDVGALLARLPLEGLEIDAKATAALHADADLLAAALINLADNALRHGAQHLCVTTPRPNCVQLVDDGRGASPERVAELQHAITSEQYEGRMGLGLMLADIVARAHGGSVRLLAVPQGFGVELDLGGPAAAAP